MTTLARPHRGFGTQKAKLAGVCAALGRRFGIPVRYVRFGFVASLVIPGPQIFAYIGLWWLIPAENQ